MENETAGVFPPAVFLFPGVFRQVDFQQRLPERNYP
jgi:hypothetical protein